MCYVPTDSVDAGGQIDLFVNGQLGNKSFGLVDCRAPAAIA